jgi:hypothetical protein
MTETEYGIALGKILAGCALKDEEANGFFETVLKFTDMLDEGDCDDVFGTNGWRHRMGWD